MEGYSTEGFRKYSTEGFQKYSTEGFQKYSTEGSSPQGGRGFILQDPQGGSWRTDATACYSLYSAATV